MQCYKHVNDLLRFLQTAGVQCAGISSLWLEADGSYQEEGMRNVKDSIWAKVYLQLAVLFSVQFPCFISNLEFNGDAICRREQKFCAPYCPCQLLNLQVRIEYCQSILGKEQPLMTKDHLINSFCWAIITLEHLPYLSR